MCIRDSYFEMARRTQGNTGELLLVICECRLDNVVRRAGFAATRPQARQGIVHRHFQLNGVTVNKPGIMVRPGDVVTLRKRPNIEKLYKGISESLTTTDVDWINSDMSNMSCIVTVRPTFEDVSLLVDVNQVVSLMSR